MPYERSRTLRRKLQDVGSLAPLRGSKYRMIDAHLHVVNFVQETPGGEALIDAMDRANVGKAVIFGLPVRKMWAEWDREPPDYYLADDARCYYYAYTDVHRRRAGALAARRAAGPPLPADLRLQPGRPLRPAPRRAAVRAVSRRVERHRRDPAAPRRPDRLHLRRDRARQPPRAVARSTSSPPTTTCRCCCTRTSPR